jgi:transcriptional regulator with XRE-family HTH domain
VERTPRFCQHNDKLANLDGITEPSPNQAVTPSAVVASRLKELRQRRGLTAKQFADRCAELGSPNLTVHVVANIETGRREVGVNELLLFALVLDVAAVHLLTPSERQPLTVGVTGTVNVGDPDLMQRWLRGEHALPQSNPKRFYANALEHHGGADDGQAMTEYARAMIQDSVKRIAAQYDAEAADFMARMRGQVADALGELTTAIDAGGGSRADLVEAIAQTRGQFLGATRDEGAAE